MWGLLHEPEFWYLVAALILVGGLWKRARQALYASLDSRAERIRAELDEASNLRAAAQATLAEYQLKQRDAAQEARAIIEHAEAEAARLKAQTARDLDAALARRRQLMQERIAQAEQQARTEIRALAVDLAIAAAREVIRDGLDDARRAVLVDAAITQLPQQLR
jgi:F-type H+-transporting ATPase subunit b